MTKIKVCRVTNVQTIEGLTELTIDYVGLHLVSKVTEDQLQRLNDLIAFCAGRAERPTPVLVLKHQTHEEVVHHCHRLRPPIIQLHDKWTSAQVRQLRLELPPSTQLIIVVDPHEQSNMWVRDERELADFVLLDRMAGGTGRPLPANEIQSAVTELKTLPIFIAGGLTPSNVGSLIETFQPFGVDVQTALEIEKGGKDIRKTIAFVSAVRGTYAPVVKYPPRIPTLSLALTDFPLDRICSLDPDLVGTADVVHLDHADGSVDSRFIRDSISRATIMNKAFPFTPYDCHFFIHDFPDEGAITPLLRAYQQANPFLRAAFFYVDPEDASAFRLPTRLLRDVCHRHNLSFGLCLQARPLTSDVQGLTKQLLTDGFPDYLSVAGPQKDTPLAIYTGNVGPFVRFVKSHAPNAVGVIIDRDVTIDRLASIVPFGVEGAVGGKSIWATDSPIDSARQFRHALTGQALANQDGRS